MLGLEYFSFKELWSPIVLLAAVLIGAVYIKFTGHWRFRFVQSEPVSFGQKFCFITGLVLFYLAFGGPLDLLGHLIFSAHMLSMSLAYIVAPPLVLLGIPAWMIRPLFQKTSVKKIMHAVTHPILTAVLFNMLFSIYHLPQVHDYVMTHFTIHVIFYAALLISAFMMWWVVVCPLPEMNRISDVKKMGYIFLNGVLLTPACALIIFANAPLYASFSDPKIWAEAMGYCVPQNSTLLLENFQGPAFFSIFPPLEDQQFGGVLMKLIQEIAYGSILGRIFYQWYRRENPQGVNTIDPIMADAAAFAIPGKGNA